MPSVANAELLCEPAYLWIPEGATFYTADEVIDFARAIGQQVDQPEIDAIRTLMAEGPDGQFAGFGSCIVCGRQNIKTWAIRMCVMYDAWVRAVNRVTFSAHLFRTTRDSFEQIDRLVQSFDWLRKATLKVRYANGEEGFELANGSRIDFVARSLKGGRGLGGDTVVLDEWLFGTGDMLGALVPTMSTAPKPHILYGSSPGLRTSEALRDIRDRGRAGGDPTLTYIEFTSERTGCDDLQCSHKAGRAEGCELDREEKWRAPNPALGRRISLDYVRKERREIPATEFMRERLGWWEDPPQIGSDSAFPMDSWAQAADDASVIAPDSGITFVVDTSWDRQRSWIAVCGARPDGTPHVEVVAFNFGSDWVVPWLLERVAAREPNAIGLQASGAPVSSLAEPLAKAFACDHGPRCRIPGHRKDFVRLLSGAELGRSSGAFYDAVLAGSIRHIGQPQLDEAIELASVRPIGDAWVVDRKASPIDVAPLVAAIGAFYLFSTSSKPQRKAGPQAAGW